MTFALKRTPSGYEARVRKPGSVTVTTVTISRPAGPAFADQEGGHNLWTLETEDGEFAYESLSEVRKALARMEGAPQ